MAWILRSSLTAWSNDWHLKLSLRIQSFALEEYDLPPYLAELWFSMRLLNSTLQTPI